MKSLIIGAGQVGTALKEVLSTHYEVVLRDIENMDVQDVKVLHICYPDHDGFVKNTRAYVNQYEPDLTIIHSSIPVGTTAKCGADYVYSPVRGRHPKLATEMKMFPKFVASKSGIKAQEALVYFESMGWPCTLVDKTESLELFKVLSNVHMGLEIAWRQEVERMLNSLELSSRDYHLWEKSYREGYLKTGDHNLIRSLMRPDPIGGHCILPCTEILRDKFESEILDFIVESNERVKEETLVTN